MQIDELSNRSGEEIDESRQRSMEPEWHSIDTWYSRQLAFWERELKVVIDYRAMRRGNRLRTWRRVWKTKLACWGTGFFPVHRSGRDV